MAVRRGALCGVVGDGSMVTTETTMAGEEESGVGKGEDLR